MAKWLPNKCGLITPWAAGWGRGCLGEAELRGLGMMKAREALPSHAVPSPAFMQGAARSPTGSYKVRQSGLWKNDPRVKGKGDLSKGKVLQSRGNHKKRGCFEPEGKHKKMFRLQPMINIGMM